MINWTDEALRAEADYRRQALHRSMVNARRIDRRGGMWSRLLARRRH